jgi:hypothetical protein
MKLKLASTERGDSGLLDLFAILLAVAIVGMVGYALLVRPRANAQRINCIHQVKSIGLSFRMWAGDNNDKMPGQVSTNDGGVMELVTRGSVVPFFTVMSNEICTPKILYCPADSQRRWATNFAMLTDANISYFVVPEADETMPLMWLVGDRNLATNHVPLAPGLCPVPTNRVFGWTSKIHNQWGNLAVADGSAMQWTSSNLNLSLRAHFAATNVPFRLIIP